ncbi:MAG: hypothetical protein AAFQ05_05020, partial [Pseudomonadota bacterium]
MRKSIIKAGICVQHSGFDVKMRCHRSETGLVKNILYRDHRLKIKRGHHPTSLKQIASASLHQSRCA